ncbi:redox-regulated ATPase YchF [Candidatus Uhrbacteria bacterium]|nr:redox-regulated ATPase YchF [Candidatus Uhrbacteria bacterium]
MKVGIVGLPNVGKSTLFQALTKVQVDCANYPFCTIEPNVGVVAVPDERIDALAAVSKSEKIIPAVIEFVDIAGLVRGASKGEGLGNKFLATIREVDAIVEVVRCFENPDVVHVAGKVDPMSDIEIVNLELIYADLATVEKRLESVRSQLKSGEKRDLLASRDVLERLKTALEQGTLASMVSASEEEEKAIRELHLLTRKPILYVLNVDEEALRGGFRLPDIPAALQLPISVKIEAELVELPQGEAQEYLKTLGVLETGLDRLIRASYALLGLITYLTSGPKETRAWTIRRGTKAPEAAGVIHTDFEKGFIRVEVINWKDFVAYGEIGARERGLLRTEGKEYVMHDGDVCHFRFNV